jgi:hypothetical protein
MSETLENTENSLFLIEQVDVNNLPELHGMKEKQLQIVKENPFVEIIDNKTYEEAKKVRTTLVTARTEIQNQDKLIASKIKKFREAVAGVSEGLISITKPHEEKQQSEVKRWEEIKEQEKQEKIRLEEERKNQIKNSISAIIDEALQKINKLSFETIDSLKVDFEQNLFQTDVAQFEEFELDFNEKIILIKNTLSSKITALEEAEANRLEKIKMEEERKKIAADQAKLEADRKAEQDRLAKIKADQEEELNAERKKIADEKAKQDADLAKQKAEIDAENKKLQDEKDRLAKIESERIAKEDAERKEKENAERAAKEKAEAESKAKAEAARLEDLKPEKQKAIDYLESFRASVSLPDITDKKLKVEFTRCMERIQDAISDSISVINNFK